MTLDDLERQNMCYMDFWQFLASTFISKANCAEITKKIDQEYLRIKFSSLNVVLVA